MTFKRSSRGIRRPVIGAGLAAGALLAAVLMAEGAPIDGDGDGIVTLAELQAVMPEIPEEVFVAMDADGSGGLDEIEVARAVEMGLLPGAA